MSFAARSDTSFRIVSPFLNSSIFEINSLSSLVSLEELELTSLLEELLVVSFVLLDELPLVEVLVDFAFELALDSISLALAFSLSSAVSLAAATCSAAFALSSSTPNFSLITLFIVSVTSYTTNLEFGTPLKSDWFKPGAWELLLVVGLVDSLLDELDVPPLGVSVLDSELDELLLEELLLVLAAVEAELVSTLDSELFASLTVAIWLPSLATIFLIIIFCSFKVWTGSFLLSFLVLVLSALVFATAELELATLLELVALALVVLWLLEEELVSAKTVAPVPSKVVDNIRPATIFEYVILFSILSWLHFSLEITFPFSSVWSNTLWLT